MEQTFDKLFAVNPRARAVIRTWSMLQSLIDDPDLKPADLEIKLAAGHVEEALRELVAAMTATNDNDQ